MNPVVTYSKNVFIPLTNSCRNNCAYCGFRSDDPYILDRDVVKRTLKDAQRLGCKEALFTFGELPEEDPRIRAALSDWGYTNIIDYLYDLCLDAIEYGLLPHTNPGVIDNNALKKLKEVNASMGLMLESASPRLSGPGQPHEHSPGKDPLKRIAMIDEAGKLQIPFTTGILLGIGETREEVMESLEVIKNLHDRHGHVQEIIIQNFKPKTGTPMAHWPEPSGDYLLEIFKTARDMMPEMSIQVPPNLNPGGWQKFLSQGANDLGGVSPVTRDYINPEAPWPELDEMERVVRGLGMELAERLPIYNQYIEKRWYSDTLKPLIGRYKGMIPNV